MPAERLGWLAPARQQLGLLAAEGFQRGLALQRSMRKASSTFSQSSTLRVCPMEHSRKGYVRCGDYVEVRVPKAASYSYVVSCALEVLDVEEDEEEKGEGKPSMFRIDGTIVPDSPIDDLPWTITRYLKSLRKSAGEIKLGVGFCYGGSTGTKGSTCSTTVTSRPKMVHNSPPLTTSLSRKRKRSEGKGRFAVLYSPKLGPTGLDSSDIKTRVEVYCKEYRSDKDDPSTMQDMDDTIPFYPEIVFYSVFSITIDGRCILEHQDGIFSIVQNSSLLGHFQVVYQSPKDVFLCEEGRAVPLYCVASTHTLSHCYQWEDSGGVLSASSPVLWAIKEDTYKCTVRESNNPTSGVCYSREIHLHAPRKSEDSTECRITRVDGPETCSDTSVDTPSSFVKGDDMIFPLEDLCQVTDNYSKEKLIGKGGFGHVYRAKLRHSDVAIKVLNTRGVQSIVRAESQCLLKAEVAALTRYRHTNLIMLMGYCTTKPILVYPYMQRESLYKNLHEWKVEDPLTWIQRLSILVDTCRGLAYLHSEQPPVIHHDINSSNILLDQKLTAKISDFGFSIQLPQSKGSKTVITAADGLPGTDGYRPPEYSDRKYSVLSDLFSYGVVMLECYCGLLAFSEDREANNLVDHTEEDRGSEESFKLISDKKLEPCPEIVLSTLLDIINKSTKRISKRRLPSSQVLEIVENIKLD